MAVDGAQPEACEVCGRTILKGERTRRYVSPQGDQRAACDLCRPRVEAAGWIRADRVVEQPATAPSDGGPRPGRWLAERARRVRARIEEARPGDGADAAPAIRARTRPDTPERRLRRALEEFNESEHRRTVAGLTRSLGTPRVAAVTPPGTPQDVRLTVAWDLSWYQWEVRLADEPARVRSLAKGSEIEQLHEADRNWNARASDDGTLQLGAGRNGAS
jgi:hypothetical protein